MWCWRGRYARYAASEGYAPLAPHLVYPQFLDDGDLRQRSMGLELGRAWIGACSAIWVYGHHGICEGMQGDVVEALRLGLPVHSLPFDCGGCEEVRRGLGDEV